MSYCLFFLTIIYIEKNKTFSTKQIVLKDNHDNHDYPVNIVENFNFW